MTYHEEHLEVFKRSLPGMWPQTTAHAWLGDLGLDQELAQKPLDRDVLKKLRSTTPLRDMFWLILAWGRVSRFHAATIRTEEEIWISALRVALAAADREEAYAALQSTALKTRGMGPAYFTKLLFFLRPDLSAYIMDQWTARSVNLLIRNPVAPIKLINRMSVCKTNGPETYRQFCAIVDDIAEQHGQTGEYIESCLFSTGGRGHAAAEWRRHVRSQ